MNFASASPTAVELRAVATAGLSSEFRGLRPGNFWPALKTASWQSIPVKSGAGRSTLKSRRWKALKFKNRKLRKAYWPQKFLRSVKHSYSPAAALMNQHAARPPATERSPVMATSRQGMVVPEVIPAGGRPSSPRLATRTASPETGHPIPANSPINAHEYGNGNDVRARRK